MKANAMLKEFLAVPRSHIAIKLMSGNYNSNQTTKTKGNMTALEGLTAKRDELQKQIDALNVSIEIMGGINGSGKRQDEGKRDSKKSKVTKTKSGKAPKGTLPDAVIKALTAAKDKTLSFDELITETHKIRGGQRITRTDNLGEAIKELGESVTKSGKNYTLGSK